MVIAKAKGVKNWQNLADVFYEWPLTQLADPSCLICKYRDTVDAIIRELNIFHLNPFIVNVKI